MKESLIVILPQAIAFCLATMKAKTREMKIGLIILLCSLICTWIYFFAVGMVWFDNIELPYWLSVVRSIAACLMLPFAYLVVCTCIGKSHASFSAFALFLMTVFVTIRHGAVCLDDAVPNVPLYNNRICFLYNGKIIASFINFSVVMLMQDIWILCRTGYLAVQMRKQGLRTNQRSRSIIALIFIALLMVILTVCIPLKVYEYTFFKYLHFCSYSLIFTAILILISRDFSLMPILDENEEPVYFDRKPRFEELGDKCRKLYEEEKIYLTTSLRLEDLAKMLETNRTYTAEMMRTVFDSTFAAYTNAHRVEEAKRNLLENPHAKMETIATLSGFATAPTFTKVFKAATGQTPSNWLSTQLGEKGTATNQTDNSEV